jgi:hypothetical protein
MSRLRPSKDRGKTFLAGRSHAVAKRVMLMLPEHKSVFASFFSKKEQNLLFLKKKKQKDFCSCAALA